LVYAGYCYGAGSALFAILFIAAYTEPALTGKFYGDYRISGNYRNQWPSINNAFTTATVSADFHIMQNRISTNDTWGMGLAAYNDNSANGAVKFNYASCQQPIIKGLMKTAYIPLGAGFQVTYANMLINTADLKFEDQLTSVGFTGVTSEVFNSADLKWNKIDVNAGILYNGSTSDRNNFYFGVSMYHINRPQQSFYRRAVCSESQNHHSWRGIFSDSAKQYPAFKCLTNVPGRCF
jgi:hypothetical protein